MNEEIRIEFENKLEEIIDNFDFDRVHKVMEFLNWNWVSCDGVPTIGKLVTTVQKEFRRAFEEVLQSKEGLKMSTGGFQWYIGYHPEHKEIKNKLELELKFILAQQNDNSFEYEGE